MNDFTASNGKRAWIDEDGHVRGELDAQNTVTYVRTGNVETLREFFQAEADERLGRWRWPENPDYVVYRRDAGGLRRVRVVLLTNGDFADTVEGSTIESPFKDAARAYFDAHPEQKPWHEAQPGEGWVIEIGEGDHENFQAVVVSNDGKFLYRDGGATDVTSSWIRSGRRFHPEVSA